MSPHPSPPGLFDRAWEWRELLRFATDDAPSASLGIVSGRRRQGKSLLLATLVGELGGLYHEAVEATPAEALRRLAESYREHLGLPVAPAFSSFAEAVDALLALPSDGPLVVVLDELPYLVAAEPSLPSLLATALGPASSRRRSSRTRLLVCGSALSLMGGLLRADAPLRGRAGLELAVRPSATAMPRRTGASRLIRRRHCASSQSWAARRRTDGSSWEVTRPRGSPPWTPGSPAPC